MCVETSSAASLQMGSLTWLVAEGLATLHTTRPGFCGFYQHRHTFLLLLLPWLLPPLLLLPRLLLTLLLLPLLLRPWLLQL